MADPSELFHRLSYGVYIVGAAHDGRRDGFTAAWLMQVSVDPLLLALAVNPGNATYPLLCDSGRFTVSVLARGQEALARAFGTRSGRDQDKLAGAAWRPGPGGAPILTDALAWFECEVVERRPAGDHELVVARVTGGDVARHDTVPLTYADTGSMDGSGALYPPSL